MATLGGTLGTEKEHDSTVMIRKRAARPSRDPASLYDKVVIRRRRKATDWMLWTVRSHHVL